MTLGWRVGIDIGGTFTDIVAHEPASGAVRMAKVRSDPAEPLSGLTAALGAVGLDWQAVAELVHGTTMVTNALVESRLAPVALIATRGFADVLDIGRASRQKLYDLDALPRPRADVPPALRFEVAGRMDHRGQALAPVDAAELAALPERIAASGAEAVAVSLLHSYANPAHELAVREALGDRVPFVSVSHEISPEAREFERSATTVVNASVMPMVGCYMDQLAGTVPAATSLQLFHSAGGITTPALVRERPLSLALSGPAAGAAGAAAVATELGIPRAISFDMGGTTTDVCLVLDGAVEISSDRRIAGRPIRQPITAIETIGAGGGSIVSLASGGLLVGPESAGADPGPACYGFGGTRPTIADADLVLGHLDASRPLGGSIRLDRAAAEAALAPIAGALGRSVEETALGVAQVASAVMARAVRRVSVERGIDARDCALFAFGGAGPMHACGLAEETGIDRIVVPAASGGFSALGCITAQASCSHQQTARLPSRDWCDRAFAELRRSLTDRAAAPLVAAGHARENLRIEEIALMRYAGQSGTVEVPLTDGGARAALDRDFHAAHERLYGFATGEDWILEACRVTARAAEARAEMRHAASRPAEGLAAVRCHFPGRGATTVRRVWRSAIPADRPVPGPLLVVDDWSTTVVAPGFDVRATPGDHLVLSRRDRS